MDNVLLLVSSLFLTVIGMVFIPVLPSPARAVASFVFVLFNALLTSFPAIGALAGQPIDVLYRGAPFFGHIPLRLDALSAWFVLIINFTCINGALYGIAYLKPYRGQGPNLALHWSMFLLFQASMLWVCILQNGLAFLVAWELMSLSSLLLILFEHQKKDVLKAGVNYLVQMHLAVAFLSLAFIWVYYSEGSLDFNAIGRFFSKNGNAWLFLLFFAGFGIKAGFIPFHTWLPDAHPAAPSHISGVMSGVIVKLGIYGILRVAGLLQDDLLLIGACLLVLSVTTGIFGILNAAIHRDFKKMLAYCTIENIGIIGAGIGLFLIGKSTNNHLLAYLGLSVALLHTLNHSLYKSLLFFTAGSVYQQTHTRDIEQLGGLIGKMPQTAFFFLAGALAIGGLPPLNGFVSEFLLYKGLLSGMTASNFYLSTLMMLSLSGLVLIGGLSLLAFTKNFGVIFLGSAREPLPQEVTEVSLLMRLPQFLIVGAMFSIGLFPQFYLSGAGLVSASFLPAGQRADTEAIASLTTTMAGVGMYSAFFLGLMALIFLARKYFTAARPAEALPTWACGYIAPNPRMQYTGKSFSKTLGKLLGFIVAEKKDYVEISPGELFPKTRKYSSHYADFFENSVINKLTGWLLPGLNYFQFIQNGRIQYYVLYGVFFILLIFLATLFNLI